MRKHAQARQVRIVLAFERAAVQLELSDDGTGFDTAALELDPKRGIGLRNMRERVAAIGGSLDVRSDGDGTSILAEVPVASEALA